MKATETYLILCKMDAGEITLQEAHGEILRLFDIVAMLPSGDQIEKAAVNAYKGKDLNEQRANIDKILAFENGAKWALSKLSNNGS